MTRLKRGLASVALFTAVVMALPARADWSEWRSIGSTGVEWKYSQVYKDMCALGFRNGSSRTLKGMRMKYIHSGKVDEDLLPHRLGPGQSLSGWAAFSVGDSCSNVSVRIYDLDWE